MDNLISLQDAETGEIYETYVSQEDARKIKTGK